ncbi:MAG: hypothetical protein B7Z08_00545 [Sphingomonadales bacterium 32-68-7]|nr:MAG: hypothetical protein B7Z33_00655 [Sphingomonadales bacterium 12-68-11]OYX10513.1 MAG: hypothetical protein B7Z08_00545 [Sphingomonadales bacterium 32-68-7]
MRKLVLVAAAVGVMSGPLGAQEQMDLMEFADPDKDGKVTLAEYQAFSEMGWGFIGQGKDKVKVAELDQMGQLALFGTQPDAEGFVTHAAYTAAVPDKFKLLDANKDGTLNADEVNGRALQQG